jgi:hypothetical protein
MTYLRDMASQRIDRDKERIASLKAERDEAVELLKKVVPPGEDWWCPTCQVGLSGSRVTFNEECDTCGTYLGEINAPEWAESARAFLARMEVK